MLTESQGKLEKIREESGKIQGIPSLRFGRHPVVSQVRVVAFYKFRWF